MSAGRHKGYGPHGVEEKNVQEEYLEAGMQLVRRVAFRMARRLPPNIDVDDLIGAGMEGLLKAIASFDPTRQLTFESYAKSRIRGAILDELRAGDTMTRYGRARLSEVTSAITDLRQQLGQEPSEQAIAERLGIDVEQYRKLSAEFGRAPLLAGVGGVNPDEVEGVSCDPSSQFDEHEVRRLLAQAIGQLPERTQQVLALYYQEECTQAEVGAILGVSESRVCQLLGEATARLRAKLAQDLAGLGKVHKHPIAG